MIDFDIGILGEVESVEAGGEAEHAVDHIGEFEVGAQGFFVERVFGLTVFV